MPAINEAVRLNANTTQAIPPSLGIEGILSAKSANNLALARSIAERTRIDDMDPVSFGRYSREYLDILNRTEQHQDILSWVEGNKVSNRLQLFAQADATQIRTIIAESHEAEGNFWPAAKIRYELAADSSRSRSARKNSLRPDHQNLLWRDLLQLSIKEIRQRQSETRSSGLARWLELASIVRDPALSLDQQTVKLKQWQFDMQSNRQGFTMQAPRELGLIPALQQESWQHVVALLPLSGKLASAGKAIQDGMLASQLQSSSSAMRLSFIDSNSRSTSQLINEAHAQGADLIVGPLEKQKLRELAGIRAPVPVLALNYLENTIMPANVAQFGLATEDEARDLASTLSASGAKRILLLNTSRDWASRAARSFSAHWQDDDKVLIQKTLPSEQQYNEVIQNAFAIDQSTQRKAGLQSLFGKRLEFQTRRRQDIDAVVVFANARQLATIKPLLAYHYAGDVPVLTASQINGGQTRAELRDLNGTVFKDAPFLLEKSTLKKQTKDRYQGRTQLQRLFAMGMDAYLLSKRLPLLMGIEQGPIEGATGQLQLNEQRFERSMDTALIAGSRILKKSDAAIIAEIKDNLD